MAKRNHLEIRYNNAKYNFFRNNRRTMKLSDEQKKKQKNFCFIINEVEQYGFNFFPEHYVRDNIVLLEQSAKLV
jgi:hypothetical protein